MARVTWCWRRWIAPARQQEWIDRLEAVGCATWTVTERPHCARCLLAVYAPGRAAVAALPGFFGGQVRSVPQSEWLRAGPTPPTPISRALEIYHDKPPKRLAANQLFVPHGLAFGSGEHATTFMLLRALALERPRNRVLDLGTGSGVLALAARRFGARTIVATDFDPDAVRTAQQNEALNFSTPLIRWLRADVRTLSSRTRYDLVLANLFSGILIEAAPRVAAVVTPGGQLWMSGILRTQREEVVAAYAAQRLHLLHATRRGKWVMLKWATLPPP